MTMKWMLCLFGFTLFGCDRKAPEAVSYDDLRGRSRVPAPGTPVLLQEEQNPPREDIEIEVTCRLVRDERGYWTFRFEGETNLPEGTMLRVTVYYPEAWERQVGGEIIRDVIGDYLFMHDYEKRVRVGRGGTFRTDLYHLRRKPYSIKYRAEVSCQARDQEIERLKALQERFRFSEGRSADSGDGRKTVAYYDFRVGTAEDFEREKVESAKAFDRDFKAFLEMYREVQEVFRKHRASHDAEAWRIWRNSLTARLEIIRDRNQDRFTLFKVFFERRGKFHVEDTARNFETVVDTLQKALEDPTMENLNEAKEDLDELLKAIWERMEELGLDHPKPDALRGPVGELEGVIGRVEALGRAALEGRLEKETWAEEGGRLRVEFSTRAFKLAKDDPGVTKKLYPYVVRLLSGFERLVTAVDEHLEKGTEDTAGRIRAATVELRAALDALKSFAGLD